MQGSLVQNYLIIRQELVLSVIFRDDIVDLFLVQIVFDEWRIVEIATNMDRLIIELICQDFIYTTENRDEFDGIGRIIDSIENLSLMNFMQRFLCYFIH